MGNRAIRVWVWGIGLGFRVWYNDGILQILRIIVFHIKIHGIEASIAGSLDPP